MRVPPAAPASPPPPPRPLRVLVITLEFAASTFSGNGVYARSQARALARAGHRVLVVSGRPDDLDDAAAESAASDPTADDDDASRPIVRTVPVPAATWGRLDASCGHAAFASAAAASREITRAIASHAPEVVLGVDWSSYPAWAALRDALPSSISQQPVPPFVYSNFRVFSRTDDARGTHRALEAAAVAGAAAVVALCEDDADFVAARLAPRGAAVAPFVVLPPLREDVRAMATEMASEEEEETHGDEALPRRRYVTCVVRLSPEKEPERFVDLVRELRARGTFDDDGRNGDDACVTTASSLTPVLCASTSGAYADDIRARFVEASGGKGKVVADFVDARGLRDVFSRTTLNVHPCARDAYGMTVVEAAAFGAPSIVQGGGGVGCTGLVGFEDAFVRADWTAAAAAEGGGGGVAGVADVARRALADADALRAIAARARTAALAWDEAANASAVADILRQVVDAHGANETVRRWTLPSEEEQCALAPIWANPALSILVNDHWVTIRRAESTDTPTDIGTDTVLPLGTYVVLTAYNPMGKRTDDAVNAERHARLRARLASSSSPAPAPRAVFQSRSVDPTGGADAWHEPGVAVLLPTDPSEAAAVRLRAMRLARGCGQAGAYEVVVGGDEKNVDVAAAVVACFPGLETLTCENVRMRVSDVMKATIEEIAP